MSSSCSLATVTGPWTWSTTTVSPVCGARSVEGLRNGHYLVSTFDQDFRLLELDAAGLLLADARGCLAEEWTHDDWPSRVGSLKYFTDTLAGVVEHLQRQRVSGVGSCDDRTRVDRRRIEALERRRRACGKLRSGAVGDRRSR